MSTPVNKTVNIYINHDKAEASLERLHAQTEKLVKKIEQGRKEGKDMSKEMAQLGKKKKDIEQLEAVISGKMTPTIRQVRDYVRQLRNELSNMSKDAPGYAEKFAEFEKASKNLNNLEKSVKGVGRAIKSNFSKFVSNVKTIAAGTIIGNTVQSAVEKVQGYLNTLVSGNAAMADSLSDIEKAANLTKNEVRQLNSELSDIDTRTAKKELREIAVALGQLGQDVTPEAIANVDKLNVALGDEFENADQITKEVSILRNNLQDISTNNYAEDVLKIGNAINVLGAEGLATGPVITDISNRIAGQAQQFGISSGAILGLAATYQELGIEQERGSTAFVRLLQRMGQNVEEYAKIAEHAGIKQKDFVNLVNEDAFAALLMVAKGAKLAGEENVTFSKILDELKADGSGAGEVLAKLSQNEELLTEKVALATEALKDTNSITEEFNKKNNNAAGILAKIGKRMQSAFINNDVLKGIESIVREIAILVGVLDRAEQATEDYVDQYNEFTEMKGRIEPLIEEHDELIKKTVRTRDEQKRLNDIIAEVAKTVPSAITQFDEYGRAISISTEKAKEYIRVQRAMLAENNRNTIEENEDKLADLKREATALQNALNNRDSDGDIIKVLTRTDEFGVSITDTFKLSNKEIAQLQKNLGDLQTRISGTTANIRKLKGLSLLPDEEASEGTIYINAPANNELVISETKKNKPGGNYETEAESREKERNRNKVENLKSHRREIAREFELLQADIEYLAAETEDKLTARQERELQQHTNKYLQLVDKAKKYNVNLLGLDSVRQKELDALLSKHFKERSEKEYADAKKALDLYYSQQFNVIQKKRLEGLIKDKEYNEAVKALQHRHNEDKLTIAKDYAEQVVDASTEAQYLQTEVLKDGIEDRELLEKKNLMEEEARLQRNIVITKEGTNDRLLAELNLLELKFKQETEALDKHSQQYKLKLAQFEHEKTLIIKSYNDRQKEIYMEGFQLIQSFFRSMIDVQNQLTEERLKKELDAIDKEKAYYQQLYDDKRTSKAIFDQKTEELDKKRREKENAERKKQFKQEKDLGLASVGINTANAIMEIWAKWAAVPVVAGIFTAIAAGVGVAQAAVISNKKFPEYAKGRMPEPGKGGVPYGASHAKGGIHLIDSATGMKVGEMEGNEPILSESTYRNNRAIVDMLLNSSMYQNGKDVQPNLFRIPNPINKKRVNQALDGRQSEPYRNRQLASTHNSNEQLSIALDRFNESVDRLDNTLSKGIKAYTVYEDQVKSKEQLDKVKSLGAFNQ